MPKDALYEESAQPVDAKKQARWYMTFQVLCIIFAVAAVIYLFICIMVLPTGLKGVKGTALVLSLVLWLVPLVALVLSSFLFFRVRRRFNVSYDYLFVQDELRITKVFNGRKRKHIVTLDAEHIMQLGYCEGTTFDRTYAGLNGSKPRIMTPNRDPAEGKEFIHILYSSSVGKTLYILECKKEMLEYLVLAAGRNKFIRE
ncbi:MAG: hypothetical protein HDP28_01795 [Clostridia bacterium]|nr:hypothetical protein [Clostridia bacterium]